MSGTLRAFLAVPVPDASRLALAELRETVRGRGVRWVRPETYHVTLRFLGETPEARVADLVARVRPAVAALRPFSLGLGSVAAFPSARRPRALAVDLAPAAPLLALAGAVEAAVVAAGFPAEGRPFRPHLTVGRVRDRVHPVLPEIPVQAPPFEVAEVVLFRSELRSEGARHTPLDRMPLEGPEPKTCISRGEEHDEERPNP